MLIPLISLLSTSQLPEGQLLSAAATTSRLTPRLAPGNMSQRFVPISFQKTEFP
jgi:hypothetical protein